MKIDKTNIFIIDGLGAVLSTVCLAILIRYEKAFGMPTKYLYVFIIIGSLCAIYSLYCHFNQPSNWQKHLKRVAALNITYSAITTISVFQNSSRLTTIGTMYFISEVLIIIVLAAVELYLSKRRLPPNTRSAAPRDSFA